MTGGRLRRPYVVLPVLLWAVGLALVPARRGRAAPAGGERLPTRPTSRRAWSSPTWSRSA